MLDRRKFLTVAGAGAATLSLAACNGASAEDICPDCTVNDATPPLVEDIPTDPILEPDVKL